MLCSNPSERRRSRAVRASIPALVTVLVASGCVQRKPPGLKVASLESSIVFGLKPVDVAAPPGTPQPELPPVDSRPAPEPASTPAPREIPPLPKLPPVTVPTAPTPFCRTATVSDFPTVAPQNAPTPPKAGFYFFKPTPPELFGADRYDIQPKDLQTRLILNVSKPQVTQNPVNGAPSPVGSGDVKTTTYQYDQVTYLDPAGKSALIDRIKVTDNPIYTSFGAVNFGPTEYAGQPDRGVALLNRQLTSANGSATFAPSSPLLLLPLPAISGQTWQSVSVDPASGATYILYGRIINRQRVDACGDVVEGWAVEAQTVFKDPRASTAQNATFRYFVDTANGGQLIYERVDKLSSPAFPLNGTPLDAAIPAPPQPPSTPNAAPASEWSLARRDPKPQPIP